MKTKSITAVTFILIGNMLTTYGSIGSGWTSTLTAVFGVILFFTGLISLKSFLDQRGQNGISNLIWAAVLGIIATGLGYIPLVGAIPAGILNLIAFVLQLMGLLKLKKSKTLGAIGASGVNYLLAAIVIMIIAGIFNMIPFAGGYIKPVIAFFAFILIPFGWLKIQEAMISNLGTLSKESISEQPQVVSKIPSTQTQVVSGSQMTKTKSFITEDSNQSRKQSTFNFYDWLYSYGSLIAVVIIAIVIIFCFYWFSIRNGDRPSNGLNSTSNNTISATINSEQTSSQSETNNQATNGANRLVGLWKSKKSNFAFPIQAIRITDEEVDFIPSEGLEYSGEKYKIKVPLSGEFSAVHSFSGPDDPPGSAKYRFTAVISQDGNLITVSVPELKVPVSFQGGVAVFAK